MKRTIWILAFLAACGTDDNSATDMASSNSSDMGVTTQDGGVDASGSGTDSGGPDGSTTGTDAGGEDMAPGPIAPEDYCEATVDMFCDYYLRCGRIAATGDADCRTNFLETCNAAFEPQYAALANDGKLELSREGIATCATHLSSVACERHIFDLDGPCSNVWVGQAPVGEACAPGIGSFVCGDGGTCVLGLDFCGTCEAAGKLGEACVDNRCETGATCVNDTCIARGLPGDDCDDDHPCVTGISCAGGQCQPMSIVTVGDPCSAVDRCPYQSTCRGGTCVQDALLGEDCSDASCASGWCDGSICREFIPIGDGCSEGFQCLSQQCTGGVCGNVVSACFSQ